MKQSKIGKRADFLYYINQPIIDKIDKELAIYGLLIKELL